MFPALRKATMMTLITLGCGQCVAHPFFNFLDGNDSESSLLEAILLIALTSRQYIYVADSGTNLLYRMDDMEGTNLMSYDGSALGTAFSNPSGVATDSQGRIYVASNARVYRFDDMLGSNQVEYDGNVGTTFAQIKGLSIDNQDRIYATDNTNDRIYRFDDMQGTNQIEIASGFFSNPQGITVDISGKIYVADTALGNIQQFPDMSGTGRVTYDGIILGNPFQNPFNVAVDSQSNIYVACIGNGLFRFSDMTGSNQVENNFVTTYGNPRGLALDSAGRIYFSEFTNNDRIYRMDSLDEAGLVFYGPFTQPIYTFVSSN